MDQPAELLVVLVVVVLPMPLSVVVEVLVVMELSAGVAVVVVSVVGVLDDSLLAAGLLQAATLSRETAAPATSILRAKVEVMSLFPRWRLGRGDTDLTPGRRWST